MSGMNEFGRHQPRSGRFSDRHSGGFSRFTCLHKTVLKASFPTAEPTLISDEPIFPQNCTTPSSVVATNQADTSLASLCDNNVHVPDPGNVFRCHRLGHSDYELSLGTSVG
jgi:hypothetical protein